MPAKIEFGNLARGETNPILIKEKTDENGNTILRIYQRKDLQLISNPFERIKHGLKYSLEDFGREHKTAAELLGKMGFGKVRALKITGNEKAADLIENMRSGARTGFIDEKSKTAFDKILSENDITHYERFQFYEDTYSDKNFEQDLKYISEKNDSLSLNIFNEFNTLKDFIDSTVFDNPLDNPERIEYQTGKIKKIRKEVKIFFKNHNTDSQLQQEFLKKLDKILYEPILESLGDENTKNWLLEYENNQRNASANADNKDSSKTEKIAIHNIKSAFSNHWWDSDEKKIESMIDLQYRYNSSEDVPIIITDYIEFSIGMLLKKNPGLHSKVKDLREAYDTKEREKNSTESEQEIQSSDDDKI